MSDGAVLFFIIAMTVICVGVYLLPSAVAYGRGHHQRWPIFWINLLLGWTFLGWLVAFIWSTSYVRSK